MAAPIPFDSQELRRTLGAFATGVTVITTVDGGGRPRGITVNSFNSVSLEPPLILWSLALDTPNYALFQKVERFAVNVLAEDQAAVSDRFAALENDPFAGLSTRPGLGGVPLLEGCVAVLECLTENTYPGGDHVIILGRVERLHRRLRAPLIFFDGRYIRAGASIGP